MTEEGMVIELGGRPLRFADTPGHARHHTASGTRRARLVHRRHVRHRAIRSCTRLAARTSCRRLRRCSSIQRRCTSPSRGCSRSSRTSCTSRTTERCAMPRRSQCSSSRRWTQWPKRRARSRMRPAGTRQLKRAFGDIYVAELRRSGSTLPEERLHELLAPDIELNAQGLGTWLDRKSRVRIAMQFNDRAVRRAHRRRASAHSACIAPCPHNTSRPSPSSPARSSP